LLLNNFFAFAVLFWHHLFFFASFPECRRIPRKALAGKDFSALTRRKISEAPGIGLTVQIFENLS
jgi:hypothetical protein